MEEKPGVQQETKQPLDDVRIQRRQKFRQQLRQLKELMLGRMEMEQNMEQLRQRCEECKLHKEVEEMNEQMLQEESERRSKGREKSEDLVHIHVRIYSYYTARLLRRCGKDFLRCLMR